MMTPTPTPTHAWSHASRDLFPEWGFAEPGGDGGDLADPPFPLGPPFPPAAPTREDDLAAVYRHVVADGAVRGADAVTATLGMDRTTAEKAITQLLARRLLSTDPDGRLVAVDPTVAAVALVSGVEQEIYRRRELIARIRERTEVYRRDYAAASVLPAAAAVERMTDAPALRGFLMTAAEECRREILVLQSGQEPAEEAATIARICGQQLERGVDVRILGPHRHRADLVSLGRIREVAAAGARVRTLSHVPRSAVVLDRSLAALLTTGPHGRIRADCVRDEGVVGFLLALFEDLWDRGGPVDGTEPGYADVADDLRHAIAALMAAGYTDEVMARKLGMSVRTCRRHIAVLMRDLEAVSRFQAGAQAVRRELLPR